MARNKQNEKQKKDGKHRKESKEERKDRIQSQQDAREVRSEIRVTNDPSHLVGVNYFEFHIPYIVSLTVAVQAMKPTQMLTISFSPWYRLAKS